MSRKDRKAERDQRRVDNPRSPEQAARAGKRPGVKDAYCTECGEWYDSDNSGQVNRHAH